MGAAGWGETLLHRDVTNPQFAGNLTVRARFRVRVLLVNELPKDVSTMNSKSLNQRLLPHHQKTDKRDLKAPKRPCVDVKSQRGGSVPTSDFYCERKSYTHIYTKRYPPSKNQHTLLKQLHTDGPPAANAGKVFVFSR